MRVFFHPDFPKDVRRFEAEYAEISNRLGERFRNDLEGAIEAVKQSPTGAGHILNLGSKIVPQLRRRNLKSFPFFILYAVVEDRLIFGAVIASKSDPLTWLARLQGKP